MTQHLTRQLANFYRDEFKKGRIQREPTLDRTLIGDKIAFTLKQGDFWQALHITQISIAEPHTFETYDFALEDVDGTVHKLRRNLHYVIEDDGNFISFTNIISGPTKVILTHKPPTPKIKLILLPWRVGNHQFSREVMEDLVRTCVGEVHALKRHSVPKEFEEYTSATVLEATLTENGIEALVELGMEDVQ